MLFFNSRYAYSLGNLSFYLVIMIFFIGSESLRYLPFVFILCFFSIGPFFKIIVLRRDKIYMINLLGLKKVNIGSIHRCELIIPIDSDAFSHVICKDADGNDLFDISGLNVFIFRPSLFKINRIVKKKYKDIGYRNVAIFFACLSVLGLSPDFEGFDFSLIKEDVASLLNSAM